MTRLTERRRSLLASMMKDAIYEAAVAVLTRHGMEGTTMDRVAEEAGVAKGTLYNYFSSKLELLQFVYDKTFEPMEQTVREVLEADLPAVCTVESVIRGWFEYLDRHRGLFNFLFNDYVVRGLLKDREDAGRASALRDVTTILERGIKEGVFRKVDPTQAALLLVGAVRETAEQHLAKNEASPLTKLTEDLMDFFLHGLGAGLT